MRSAVPFGGLLRRAGRFARGLRGKFIFLISGLLITSSMALGWIFLAREVRDESEKLKQKGIILARNLAANAELGVYTRNPAALSEKAREALEDAAVAFVAILDEAGKALFSGAHGGFRVPPVSGMLREESSRLPPESAGSGNFRLYREPGVREEIYLFVFPVTTPRGGHVGEEIGFLTESDSARPSRRERIGTVLVGLTSRLMREDILRLEKVLGISTLAVILLGMVLAVLLVRVVADPVRQLVEATRRIAAGDLDQILDLDSQDEIGELARSFNRMTLKIRESREELERNNALLEQNVKERTRELEATQSQLVQAEKMSVVGQLVSGVAHELNNPLAGVLGYSQLLLRMEVGEATRKGLEKIQSEADRCKRVVQNLLIFARKNKPQKRLVDLNGILESVLELKEYQLRVDNIRVVKELQSDLPPTMADAAQLQQVVINIIHNAQQAMGQTARDAVLTLRSSVRRDHVHLEIGDNGPGMPQGVLSKIFDPFFTTKEVGQGTGLGLSICYGIIQEHRGRVWAESRPGKGTTIHIEIPIGETAGSAGGAESRDSTSLPSRSGVKARILVVDDEASIVDILSDVLRMDGHWVETALSGGAGLKKFLEGSFDVILTDLKMPGMGGQELWERIRVTDPRLIRRIIFTTGDVASQETQEFLQRCGCPCLQKPFDLSEVRSLVQQILESDTAGRPDLPIVTPSSTPDPGRAA